MILTIILGVLLFFSLVANALFLMDDNSAFSTYLITLMFIFLFPLWLAIKIGYKIKNKKELKRIKKRRKELGLDE